MSSSAKCAYTWKENGTVSPGGFPTPLAMVHMILVQPGHKVRKRNRPLQTLLQPFYDSCDSHTTCRFTAMSAGNDCIDTSLLRKSMKDNTSLVCSPFEA